MLYRFCVGACVALLFTGCTSIEGGRLYVRGTEALERGEYGIAVDSLSRAAELITHPSQASNVQNHLGLAYLGEGERSLALDAFHRALALDCRNEAAQQNLDAVAGTEEREDERER